LDKIEKWFAERIATLAAPRIVTGDLGALTIVLMTAAQLADATSSMLAFMACAVVQRGGSVLIPMGDSLLSNKVFCSAVIGATVVRSTLAYGQRATRAGLHIIASETEHWVENLTGLGGCGAHLVLTVVSNHTRQGHPLVPVIQAAESTQRAALASEEVDLFLTGEITVDTLRLEKLLVAVAELKHKPVANAQGMVDFQFTRGLLGVTS